MPLDRSVTGGINRTTGTRCGRISHGLRNNSDAHFDVVVSDAVVDSDRTSINYISRRYIWLQFWHAIASTPPTRDLKRGSIINCIVWSASSLPGMHATRCESRPKEFRGLLGEPWPLGYEPHGPFGVVIIRDGSEKIQLYEEFLMAPYE